MKTIIKKSFIIILLIITTLMLLPKSVNADSTGMSGLIEGGDSFISDGKKNPEPKEEGQSTAIINFDTIKSGLGSLYNVLFVLGTILAVVIGLVLGLKFLLGSIEEQAQVKEMLIPYVLGCVVIFGAFGIWKLVVTILSSLN